MVRSRGFDGEARRSDGGHEEQEKTEEKTDTSAQAHPGVKRDDGADLRQGNSGNRFISSNSIFDKLVRQRYCQLIYRFTLVMIIDGKSRNTRKML